MSSEEAIEDAATSKISGASVPLVAYAHNRLHSSCALKSSTPLLRD